jgi:Pin2-interacting protein X1
MGKMKQSADPNNTAWAKDTSRFGFQMLEKMGWKQGKGLGKEEQGHTDHVKVQQREGNIGIGAEKSTFVCWTVHRDNFEDLLKKLGKPAEKNDDASSASSEPSEDVTSPVPKSRSDRKRKSEEEAVEEETSPRRGLGSSTGRAGLGSAVVEEPDAEPDADGPERERKKKRRKHE